MALKVKLSLHGSHGRYQRTRFVTSTHRDHVIQALDFRNRFSSRPFLCEELLPSGDTQGRYSNITTSLWPKFVKHAEISTSSDGTVTLVSTNHHVTLILSNHGRDFTVCYLSKLSRTKEKLSSKSEKYQKGKRNETLIKQPYSLENTHNESKSDDITVNAFNNKNGNAMPKDEHTTTNSQNTKCFNSSENSCNLFRKNGIIFMSPSTEYANREKETLEVEKLPSCKEGMILDNFKISSNSAFCQYENDRKLGTDDGDLSLVERCHNASHDLNDTYLELNIQGSNEGVEENSYRKNSTSQQSSETCKKNVGFCKNSSCEQNVSKPTVNLINYDISSLNSSFADVVPNEVHQNYPSDVSTNTKSSVNLRKGSYVMDGSLKCEDNPSQINIQSHHKDKKENLASNQEITEKETTSAQHNDSAQISNDSAQINLDRRILYTWVTQHCSTVDCPTEWKHPLCLAQHAQKEFIEKATPSALATNQPATPTDDIVRCPLPVPLPQACPGQHLHKLVASDTGEIGQSGTLKMVLLEGVIYRFAGRLHTKTMDIYPGDGSVVYSDSCTAQYFTHVNGIHPQDWRSYSVKCPPPDHPNQPYSVSKLINTACRYAGRMATESLCSEPICWQFQPETPSHTKSQLLEECRIPKVGRYRAYNNGLISVLFSDRTSLEMVADLTPRLKCDIKYKSGDVTTQITPQAIAETTANGTDRLSTSCNAIQEIIECDNSNSIQITSDMTARTNQITSDITRLKSNDAEVYSDHLTDGKNRLKSTGVELECRQLVSNGECKLMLPSGQYVCVDAGNAGHYQWYVTMAQEWIAWVNESPLTRESRSFCQDWRNVDGYRAVEKELQKINCFNYILDNSSFNHSRQKNTPSTSIQHSQHATKDPSTFPTQQNPTNQQTNLRNHQPNLTHQQPPFTESQPNLLNPVNPPIVLNQSNFSNQRTISNQPNHLDNTPNQPSISKPPPPNFSYRSNQQHNFHTENSGFNNYQDVLSALNQTSRIINDIDSLLLNTSISKT